MEVRQQRILAVSVIAFLIIVVVVSFAFEDVLPRMKQPEGTTGGYQFHFDVECVDEDGTLLKVEQFTGNGTLWSFTPPDINGYKTNCQSITYSDITNWRYPASHYIREAAGSIRIEYSPLG